METGTPEPRETQGPAGPGEIRRPPGRWLSELAVYLLCLPIRLYRVLLSPLVGQVCRFHPTCSRYALDALQAHGPLKGSWLTLRRLSRCQPFHPGGLDPVPPPAAAPAAPSGEKG